MIFIKFNIGKEEERDACEEKLPESFMITMSLPYLQEGRVSLVPLNVLKKKKEQLSRWIHHKWYVSQFFKFFLNYPMVTLNGDH